jgi:hypothetical protein
MPLLTASFFENGPIPSPTKSRNTTIMGSGDPDSAQLSHPSRFCHWHSSFCDNAGYPPFKGTTQNQNLFLQKDFFFLQTQAQKKILQLVIHGDPAKCGLRKIMSKIIFI